MVAGPESKKGVGRSLPLRLPQVHLKAKAEERFEATFGSKTLLATDAINAVNAIAKRISAFTAYEG
jgi:hypothetical protein